MLHARIALIVFHFPNSVSTVQISTLYFSPSSLLIAAYSGLFKRDFLLFPLALQRFPLGIIARKHFFPPPSLYIFLPSFGCCSHSPFWLEQEIFSLFADDGYWSSAFFMTVCVGMGETLTI